MNIDRVGIVCGIVVGLWGASLSTYQEWRSHEKEAPILFTQLSVSRAAFVAGATERPVTMTVIVNNAGKAPVTLLPDVDFVAFDPASGSVGTLHGQFPVNGGTYALPKTLSPGEQTTVTATNARSDYFFGPNLVYLVTIQTADGKVLRAEDVAAIPTPEGYRALEESVKYQANVRFHSKLAVELRSNGHI